MLQLVRYNYEKSKCSRRCSCRGNSLINGLVTSRIDYCNALLHGLPNTLINKLQRVQNTAARIITSTTRRSHITPVLKELHWLPVQYRIQYKIQIHTYNALHDRSPLYIKDMLNIYRPNRTLRSQNNIREANTIYAFKKLLKTHFFLVHFGH